MEVLPRRGLGPRLGHKLDLELLAQVLHLGEAQDGKMLAGQRERIQGLVRLRQLAVGRRLQLVIDLQEPDAVEEVLLLVGLLLLFVLLQRVEIDPQERLFVELGVVENAGAALLGFEQRLLEDVVHVHLVGLQLVGLVLQVLEHLVEGVRDRWRSQGQGRPRGAAAPQDRPVARATNNDGNYR